MLTFRKMMVYGEIAFERNILKRALYVAFVVGTLLNIINQGAHFIQMHWFQLDHLKLFLTYLVPYLVSTYSSVLSRLTFLSGEVSGIDAIIECKDCEHAQIEVQKGDIIPYCVHCTKKTKWKLVDKAEPAKVLPVERYRSMALFAELNPSPVLRIDTDGIITKVNPSAKIIFNNQQLEGCHVTELLPGMKHFDLPDIILNGHVVQHIEDVDGNIFQFDLRGIPESRTTQIYGMNITETRIAERENNQLREAVEQSYNSIMITDIDGKIEYVNKAFEEKSGYSLEEVLGHNPRFLKTGYLPDDVYKEMWETISKGGRWQGLFHNRRKDGSTYWEQATITAVKDEAGHINNYMSIKEDVTDYTETKEALESMALFAKLNPDPVFRFDREGKVTESNPAANEAFDKESINGMYVKELFPGIKNIDIPGLIKNNDKTQVYFDANGRIYYFTIRGIKDLEVCQIYGSDVTDKLQAEKAVESMALFARLNPAPVFRFDISGIIRDANPAAKEAFKKEEIKGLNIFDLMPGMPEDDIESLVREDKVVNHVEEINGRIFYFVLRGVSSNEVCQIYGSDITEQRKAEEAFQSMALFAKLNPEPVFRFGMDEKILEANPAAQEVWPDTELPGTNVKELIPNLAEMDVQNFIEDNLKETFVQEVDGEVFRFMIRGIKDLGVCQTYGSNITQRVRAEEKVQRQSDNIRGSIRYASRIQTALLPEKEVVDQFLPEHFVLFKPRDVVSGDFYWIKKYGDKTVVVAADCTGHGVPGAFMSMLGVAFLNELVNEMHVPSAHEILNELRAHVKETLDQKDHSGPSDGMDLALTIIDTKQMTAQYAGAFNSLYIIRDQELIEYKADKMPIGIYVKEKESFTSHDIDLQKDDRLYMFSDGYADQIGGERDRKFSKARFKEMLMTHHQKSMEEQSQIYDQQLIAWMGEDNSQIDDILVMGLRI